MTTDSSQTATKSLGRLRARGATEPTTVITKPHHTAPSDLDERAANEATLVDAQVADRIADRIAAELVIARSGDDPPENGPREPKRASRLGEYGLMSYLASGRTSHVYLARLDGPAGFARHLAIKALRADHARDPRRVAAFFEAARLFSTLHHASIAQIVDVGVDGDTHYLVMDHLHGMPVRTALERRPGGLPLDFAITVIASCAEALHYARSKQPERDSRCLGIAPSYVMACADGSVKLFHLGHTGDPTPTLTSRELAYLSPEHARGEAVDARSEVFALGVMLYELITGLHPYLDPSSEPTCRSARDRLVHAEVEPPAMRFPHVPPELSDVVMTALARDPDSRYCDGRVFSQALHEVAQRLSLRPGPLAVRQLVGQLLVVPPAKAAGPAPLSPAAAATCAPTVATVATVASQAVPAAEPAWQPVRQSDRWPVSHPVRKIVSQPLSILPAWAGPSPHGAEGALRRLRARGTSPLGILHATSLMRTDERPRASGAERATTLSCRPLPRQRQRRRALAALVLISAMVTLVAGLMIGTRSSARPLTTLAQPMEKSNAAER
jgi:eukaryotic-like serine/threonine-protein kinase